MEEDTGRENEIPAEEITITFVARNYPRKMIRHLLDVRKYTIITKELLNEYRGKENNNLYSAAMQVIVAANEQQFKEDNNMCDALMKIINEKVDEKAEALANERAEVLANERAEILAKQKTEKLIKRAVREGRLEGKLEGKLDSVKNLIESLKITADQAMDLLKIPSSERSIYRDAVNK